MPADLIVKNCRIVTAEGALGPGVGIAVTDGKISAISSDRNLPDGTEVVDCEGDYVVPGIIDCHVHNRTPGAEYKEDWVTVSEAAAAGGVATIPISTRSLRRVSSSSSSGWTSTP
jgi:dihydroorotase/allantoinase